MSYTTDALNALGNAAVHVGEGEFAVTRSLHLLAGLMHGGSIEKALMNHPYHISRADVTKDVNELPPTKGRLVKIDVASRIATKEVDKILRRAQRLANRYNGGLVNQLLIMFCIFKVYGPDTKAFCEKHGLDRSALVKRFDPRR